LRLTLKPLSFETIKAQAGKPTAEASI
jgi:hypothetical protein